MKLQRFNVVFRGYMTVWIVLSILTGFVFCYFFPNIAISRSGYPAGIRHDLHHDCASLAIILQAIAPQGIFAAST